MGVWDWDWEMGVCLVALNQVGTLSLTMRVGLGGCGVAMRIGLGAGVR